MNLLYRRIHVLNLPAPRWHSGLHSSLYDSYMCRVNKKYFIFSISWVSFTLFDLWLSGQYFLVTVGLVSKPWKLWIIFYYCLTPRVTAVWRSQRKLCALPAGTSVLLCWPSAWNEKCLMPLVCSEGLSLFRRWTAMHYWLQNTPAMLFHLSGAAESGWTFLFSGAALVWINPCTLLTDCMFCACDVLLLCGPPPPAETTPLISTSQSADRELQETKDKR